MICVDGTFTETATYGSRPSYVTSYSATESGTKTVTCEDDGMVRAPLRLGPEKPFGTLPPHLDPGHDLGSVHTRRDGGSDHRLHLPR